MSRFIISSKEANAKRVPMVDAAGQQLDVLKIYFGHSDPKVGETIALLKPKRAEVVYRVKAACYTDKSHGEPKLEKLVVERVES